MKAERSRLLLALLFVIPVVLAALSGLTLAAMAAGRERARREGCRARIRNAIGYGAHLYASDFNEAFPPNIGTLYPDWFSDGKAVLCPSAGKATPVEHDPDFSRDDYTPATFGDTHTDYVYVSGLTADDPAGYVLAFEDEWNHDGDGVHVLFVGSNVEWMGGIGDIDKLHRLLARQEKELAANGRKMKLLRPAWSSWPDPPAGERPRWGPRPWYSRPGARSFAVGAIAGLVVGLALIVPVDRRGW